MAKPIEVKGFGGINKNHDRALGQPSDGQNFRTRNKKLFTRDGTSYVTAPDPCTSVKSLHSAAKVSADTRQLLEEGTNLWHRTTGAWAVVKNNVNGTRLQSCRWQDFLLLVNGNDMLAYDVTAKTIAPLSGSPPAMQYVINWKFRPFGWAPNFAYPHFLWFCGYDINDDISKDVWPAEYFLNIGGEAGTPILDAIPFKTHLVCFTKSFYKRVYGDDETNYEILPGGDVGLYNTMLSCLVLDMIVWVGHDKRVYFYSGTSPVPISGNIDELLEDEDFSDAFMRNVNNQAWLFFPLTSTTKVYIYDPTENEWYIDVYPAVITAGYSFGAYNAKEDHYFGTDAGKLIKVDSSVTVDVDSTEITTDVKLGPFDAAGAEFWVNNLHVNAEPKNDFDLNVFATCDRRSEQGPFQTSFTEGTQITQEVTLKQVRGQNIMLRLSSTDKINELQRMTMPMDAWGVK